MHAYVKAIRIDDVSNSKETGIANEIANGSVNGIDNGISMAMPWHSQCHNQ